MASTKAKLGLSALLAATVTTPLVLQHQSNRQLHAQIDVLRAQLAAAQPGQPLAPADTAGLERLRNDHAELLRLRGQVTQLRQQLASQPKASTNPSMAQHNRAFPGERQAVEAENARTLLAKSPEIPMTPVSSMTNAGYSTALASLQTMHWAVANRDTNAMMNTVGLEPEARKRADELFAQMPQPVREKYGSVDALLVDWRMNLAENPQAFRVLSRREQDSENVVLTVQFQYPSGRVRENDLSFYRDEQGLWRAAMPAQVMEKLPDVVNNQTQ